MKQTQRLAGHKGFALLLGLSLFWAGGLRAADSNETTGASKSRTSSRIHTPSRPAADSRVLSTRPASGNGTKVRVLTKDGRVRDVVINKDQKQ